MGYGFHSYQLNQLVYQTVNICLKSCWLSHGTQQGPWSSQLHVSAPSHHFFRGYLLWIRGVFRYNTSKHIIFFLKTTSAAIMFFFQIFFGGFVLFFATRGQFVWNDRLLRLAGIGVGSSCRCRHCLHGDMDEDLTKMWGMENMQTWHTLW